MGRLDVRLLDSQGGNMHWIIIAIIAIMVVVEIVKKVKELLWDSGILPFMLRLAACAVAVYTVHWLYGLVGFPVWLIGALAIFLIVYNVLLWVIYLYVKNKYVKILDDASAQYNEIVHAVGEFAQLMKNKILDVINEAGMATDVEIFEKLRLGSKMDDLNNKKDELSKKIEKMDAYYGMVKEMKAVTEKENGKSVFTEQLKVLLDEEEIKIQTNLNGNEKTAKSWDNNLYCTTKPYNEGSNVLPTIYMEID